MALITCHKVSKTYGQAKALDEVSFSIEQGKLTAILGRNGSGKTTLIKILLNMLAPSSGMVSYEGTDVGQLGYRLYQRTAAVLESIDNLYDYMTGQENIEYFSSLQGLKRAFYTHEVQDLIARLQLTSAIKKPCGSYSRGMKQKLSLVIALVSQADILFLDEPTLGLDFESCRLMTDTLKWLVKEQGKTIILTSHQADLIEEVADNVLLLDKGKLLFSGSLDQFKAVNQEQVAYLLTCRRELGDSYQFTLISREDLTEFLKSRTDLLSEIVGIEEINVKIDDILAHFYKEAENDRISH